MDAAGILQALLTPAGRRDPYPLYAEAHRLGPIAGIGGGWYLVAGHAAVNQALRNPGFGLADPGMAQPSQGDHRALASLSLSILQSDPPDHGRMRSLISSVFTPRRIAALRPGITDSVDELLDRLGEFGAGGPPPDFMAEFAFRLPVTVICQLLGVPAADQDRFRPLAADLTTALEFVADPAGLDAADRAASELAGYFGALIDERRIAPRDDLIGALVAARDAGDGRLSHEELVANLILLLVAGFETTTNLLGNGLAILFDRPDIAAALRADPAGVPGFIEEVLRYDAPVQVTSRVAIADGLSVAGTPVPRDSHLVLLLGAANRDPARYRDPDVFDPTRVDTQQLGFGAGAHFCLGNGLARLEADIAFPRLLGRFPELGPAPGPARRDRLVLRGYETLPVVRTAEKTIRSGRAALPH